MKQSLIILSLLAAGALGCYLRLHLNRRLGASTTCDLVAIAVAIGGIALANELVLVSQAAVLAVSIAVATAFGFIMRGHRVR